jgi:hypothetical protein
MRSSFVRAMAFQSTTKFLPNSRWFLGSLLFVTDKFGDLNLQEPESCEVTGLGIDCLPPTPVQVSLAIEAQFRNEIGRLGETDSDPLGDKSDHTMAVHAAITDPFHQSSSESDSEGDREVYLVGKGDQPPKKTAEEIQREAEEEIFWAIRLAREAERGKRHNGL